MKAIRLVEIGKPLQEQELPVPEIGDRDVLVRVRAAGICHSDAHQRAGIPLAGPVPLTLGHEIAGVVERVGERCAQVQVGARVCVHYIVSCGDCPYCVMGHERFCVNGAILGIDRDGGFAEFVAVPERSVIPLPDEIPFAQGAVLMCSSATAFHALRKSGLKPGERVAVFGAGGLGMSAVQLARVFGALEVYAVDINASKLRLAERYGAIPVDAARLDPVAEIRRLTDGRGVDVALELVGLPQTMRQAVQCLGVFGRAMVVGITGRTFEVHPFSELLRKEAEIIGVTDHTLHELLQLIELTRRGLLDLSDVITRTIPLEADAVNETLDALEKFGDDVRTVIIP